MNSPNAATAPPETGLDPRRWFMLVVALVAMFMAIFDFYVINIATPSLQSQLHASEATLELIIGGYTFTYASLLVTGGRFGDIFSYRKVFITGMAIFTATSLLCGLAQTGTQLVVLRLLQGVGAALMVPQVVALITVTFPPKERPKALSWFGVSVGLALVGGQILGGALLQLDAFGSGWRIIFLVNIPVGIVAMLLAIKLLPPARAQRRPRQDVVGTIGISISLGLAILPIVIGRSEGWPIWGWVMLALAVPAFIGTMVYERKLGERGGEPMLDLGLFKIRSFTVGVLTIVGIMTFFSGFLFGMTLFLQAGLHLTPLEAGLTFGPLGIGFAVSALVARPLVMKHGMKVIISGQALLVLGAVSMLAELAWDGVNASAGRMIVPMVLAGLGTGITIPSLTGVVVSQIPPQRAGLASGLLTTAQQFANTIGVAVFGVIFFSNLGTAPSLGDYVTSMQWVTGIGLALCVATLALSFLLPRGRPMPPKPPTPGAPTQATATAGPQAGAK
ncbi:MAG: MFS transporter [Umezawaea sp.]